jgi:hypothetical protein
LEDYPQVNLDFLSENNIKLYQFGVAGNKVLNTLTWLILYINFIGTICGYS